MKDDIITLQPINHYISKRPLFIWMPPLKYGSWYVGAYKLVSRFLSINVKHEWRIFLVIKTIPKYHTISTSNYYYPITKVQCYSFFISLTIIPLIFSLKSKTYFSPNHPNTFPKSICIYWDPISRQKLRKILKLIL